MQKLFHKSLLIMLSLIVFLQNKIKKMEQKHRNILQTNFAYLIKNLHNVEEICDHLVSDDILTSGMMDSIKVCHIVFITLMIHDDLINIKTFTIHSV